MWAIHNETPFAVERSGARARDGSEVWLVGLKATFDMLDDGVLEPAAEQEPVHLAPKFRGDPAFTSLMHDADLVWGKPATDVFVVGSAHSHGGPVTQLRVAFQIGPVARQATVVGDRVWVPGGITGLLPCAPAPFVSMPLVWERAFGGTDLTAQPPRWEPRNPVGRGYAPRARTPLPNIEDPNAPIRFPVDRPVPVGFGPISRHWEPRARYAGTYDETWMRERRPLLPDDFDERYQLGAPPEQQVPRFLSGGEEVHLHNLHPRFETYFTRLPHVDLAFRTHFRGRPSQDHRGRLTSIVIDSDRGRLLMAWTTELPCHHSVYRLLETEVRIMPRVRVPAGRGERL